MNNSANARHQADVFVNQEVLISAASQIASILELPGEFVQNDALDLLYDLKIGENIASRLVSQKPKRFPTGHLSIGLPYEFEHYVELNKHLFWIPKTADAKQICLDMFENSLHLASSRIGRDFDRMGRWFEALRTHAIRAKKDSKVFLSSPSVTSHRFTERLSELLNFQQILFIPLGNQKTSTRRTNPNAIQIFVSSPLDKNSPKDLDVDALLATIANQLHVLKVRRNGKVHQNIRERIANGQSTRLLVDASLTSKKLTTELIDNGVIGWWLYGKECNELDTTQSGNVISLANIDESRFLIHWTRSRTSPSPSQTEQEFIDDLLFGVPSDTMLNSNVANLCRILASQTICGSNTLTRGEMPVVCLSAIELSELNQRQRFQLHLARWDALPYGIAIDRDLLIQLGARPVIYGQNSDWKNLAPVDQPFFQLKSTSKNWQAELEYRIPHRLDLGQIPTNKALVFVPSVDEANIVSRLSRWPVTILHSADQ